LEQPRRLFAAETQPVLALQCCQHTGAIVEAEVPQPVLSRELRLLLLVVAACTNTHCANIFAATRAADAHNALKPFRGPEVFDTEQSRPFPLLLLLRLLLLLLSPLLQVARRLCLTPVVCAC
jgi:hypothetical protein